MEDIENPKDVAGLVNLFKRIYYIRRKNGDNSKELWMNLSQKLVERFPNIDTSLSDFRKVLNKNKTKKKKESVPEKNPTVVVVKKQENKVEPPKRQSRAITNKMWSSQTSLSFGLPMQK